MTENLNNDEESRLIERLILGEEKAFCKLYVQYKPRLFKFAIALLKSQNVAEDICQDIFFNIWENRYFLKCGTSFSSFLFSMARNRIINYLRDESCHKRILESLYEQAIDFDNSTKNTILANDLGEHMKHAVKLLSNRQREVFELSRHHMLTNKEIAEQLNISISTVQDHLSASLKIIRTYFKKYNPQIKISAESETKRSIFREKDKTKRSKKESAQHSKSRNKSFVMTSVSAL